MYTNVSFGPTPSTIPICGGEDKLQPVQFLTIPQLMESLQISRSQVDRLLKNGLPCLRVGSRQVRFDLATVVAWLATRKPEKGE